MADNITVSGIPEVQTNLSSILSQINIVIPRVLTDVALDLLSKAKERAPIDTGDLRGTGFMELEGDKDAIVGFTEEYALRQHEGLEYTHPLGGEAKYLENPLKENQDRYIEYIKDAVRRVTD